MHLCSCHLPELVVLAALTAACGMAANATPAATAAPTQHVPTATSSPTDTPSHSMPRESSRTDDGPVIHVNLAVPLATLAPMGSDCGVGDLRETGPKAATIPGAPVELFDIDQPPEGPRVPDTPRPGETVGSQQPDATNSLEGISVGKPTVPDTGVVAEPISDDPDFPTACVFTFDVVTTADVERAYLFAIGSVYFPVPAILRADLETAGWVANIGVNPQ